MKWQSVIGWILGVVWILFLFGVFDRESTPSNNKATVDCAKSTWRSSEFCNGSFEQAGNLSDEYYQRMGR